MKITISVAEIKKLLADTHNLASDFELEIVTAHANVISEVQRIINRIESVGEVRNNMVSVDRKVAAIKAFREECPCGLAEAKYIVEHWSAWKTLANEQGRIPKINPGFGEYQFVFS